MSAHLDDASLYTAELLAQACADRQSDNAHEPFCFELFRRAITRLADGSECWEKILALYRGQVAAWLRSILNNVRQSEIDDLVSDTFLRFFRYYTAKKLDGAGRGIASIMAFLKKCARSEAVDALRSRQRSRIDDNGKADSGETLHHTQTTITEPAPESPDLAAERKQLMTEVWQRIEAIARNEKERTVARLAFSEGLPPRKIYASRPDLFKNAADVSETKRTLCERLSQDMLLLALLRNLQDGR
jgi:RNA polymerase sigma factor (sigma-70 family)